MSLTIGELAKRTGLTVRTLHHYDEVGLLRPSARSEAGYRLYTDQDVIRLHRILALRQMNLPLKDIQAAIRSENLSLTEVLKRQVQSLEAQIRRQERLVYRLKTLLEKAESKGGETLTADQLLEILEMMNLHDKYFSEDELDALQARRRLLEKEQLLHLQDQWPDLINRVRAEMNKGTDPRSETVLPLALRWLELVRQITGNDANLMRKSAQMLVSEPLMRERTGLDLPLMEYVRAALVGRGLGLPSETAETPSTTSNNDERVNSR